VTTAMTKQGTLVTTRYEQSPDGLIEHVTLETPTLMSETQRLRLVKSWETPDHKAKWRTS
jgi:hypothetical protein